MMDAPTPPDRPAPLAGPSPGDPFLCGLILAGGRSRRMGRDKAWLEVDGRPLLLRQLDLLGRAGLHRIAIAAGPEDRPALPVTPDDTPLLRDRFPDLGPLAGIEAGIAWAQAIHPDGWTLVVAVDLPELSVAWLRSLMGRIGPLTGCVPVHQGRLEPLAAIYPNRAGPIAAEHLATKKASVQELCRRGLESGWMTPWELDPEEARALTNWNTPQDAPDGAAGHRVSPGGSSPR